MLKAGISGDGSKCVSQAVFCWKLIPDFLNISKMLHGATERESSVGGGTSFARNLITRKPAEPKINAAVAAAYTPSADFTPSDTSDLKEGDRVEHMKFGLGSVTKMDVNGTDRKATVKFDIVGEKTLLLSFAKLQIVK